MDAGGTKRYSTGIFERGNTRDAGMPAVKTERAEDADVPHSAEKKLAGIRRDLCSCGNGAAHVRTVRGLAGEISERFTDGMCEKFRWNGAGGSGSASGCLCGNAANPPCFFCAAPPSPGRLRQSIRVMQRSQNMDIQSCLSWTAASAFLRGCGRIFRRKRAFADCR